MAFFKAGPETGTPCRRANISRHYFSSFVLEVYSGVKMYLRLTASNALVTAQQFDSGRDDRASSSAVSFCLADANLESFG